jgi:hypothetical protein
MNAGVLDAARLEGDPPADACVAALGERAFAVNAQLRHLHRNADPLPAALPREVQLFFESIELPDWAEPARIASAQRWAAKNLLLVSTALFAASLPSTYAAARGARVLVATGRMVPSQLERRVNETARFVLDVLAPGGFSAHGSALTSIRKVRLVHASVRCWLASDSSFGSDVPINQEDMAGTALAFSATVLEGAQALGASFDETTADDFVHLWAVASSLLGARDDLLPRSFAEAMSLRRLIAERQYAPSDHGRRLMASLLSGMEAHCLGPRALPRMVVRYLVGERLADLLGVPAAPGPLGSLAALTFISTGYGRALSHVLGSVAPLLGKPLLEAVIAKKLRGGTASFELPYDRPRPAQEP